MWTNGFPLWRCINVTIWVFERHKANVPGCLPAREALRAWRKPEPLETVDCGEQEAFLTPRSQPLNSVICHIYIHLLHDVELVVSYPTAVSRLGWIMMMTLSFSTVYRITDEMSV